MSRLRFGMLGMSEGNGHPYSWSAIFNGYDPAAMAKCPFAAIPAYLATRQFPRDAIGEASVTHVWTQARALSEHIAAAARIPHVVDDAREMIGNVDGILLARDDADDHYDLAAPFLHVGLPIYIDKPLAFTVKEAERIYAGQRKPGQIFTCSALAYADEFRPGAADLAALGKLRSVAAVTVKDWDHYSVHVIEPLMALVNHEGKITQMRASGSQARRLDITWESGLTGHVTALGVSDGDIRIKLDGMRASREMIFSDTFSAFRAALRHFTDIVLRKAPPQDPLPVLDIVRIIEAGRAPR